MKLFFSGKSTDLLVATAEGLAKIATFFIIPISGLFLPTSDFNLWSIIFPSIQILASAISFGLPNYVLRSYFVKGNENKVDNSPVYIAFSLLFLFSLFCFIAIKSWFSENLFLRWDIFMILVTNSFLLIIQQKYQSERNGVGYFNQSFVWRIGFAILLVLFFLFNLEVGLDFMLKSLLFIQLGLLAVAIYKDCRFFKSKINWKEQSEIIKFGFPLFLTGVLQFMIYMNSRYFVYNKGEVHDTAIFSIIHTFIGTLNLLFVIFVRIYVPRLFEVLSGEKDMGSLFFYKKVMFPLFEIVSILIFIGLFCYSAIFRFTFEDEIFRLTPILIFGQFFYSLQIFIIDSMLYYQKTINMFLISLVSAAFSIIIGYLLVQKFGIYGASVGVALTQFLSLIIVIYFTGNLYEIIIGVKYSLIRVMRISILMFTAFCCYNFLGHIAVIVFFIILMGCLIWELKIPKLIKKFM
jgi:O-antigen/teichoic acid export membrane protein